jgi:hypothetical protein
MVPRAPHGSSRSSTNVPSPVCNNTIARVRNQRRHNPRPALPVPAQLSDHGTAIPTDARPLEEDICNITTAAHAHHRRTERTGTRLYVPGRQILTSWTTKRRAMEFKTFLSTASTSVALGITHAYFNYSLYPSITVIIVFPKRSGSGTDSPMLFRLTVKVTRQRCVLLPSQCLKARTGLAKGPA